MTTGEKRFSTAGRQVKSGFPVIPQGEYELVLKPGSEVRTADGPGKIPYVNCQFEVLGTAKKEGGKNLTVYHRFLLGLNPGKDGIINMDRGNGLTAFSAVVDQAIDAGITERDVEVDGSSVHQEFLNPREVVEFLNTLEGKTVRAYIKVKKSEGYDDSNEIGRFSPNKK
jgi:hypothetical protein